MDCRPDVDPPVAHLAHEHVGAERATFVVARIAQQKGTRIGLNRGLARSRSLQIASGRHAADSAAWLIFCQIG